MSDVSAESTGSPDAPSVDVPQTTQGELKQTFAEVFAKNLDKAAEEEEGEVKPKRTRRKKPKPVIEAAPEEGEPVEAEAKLDEPIEVGKDAPKITERREPGLEPAEEEEPEQQAEAEAEEGEPVLLAPADMNKEEKAIYDSLPKEAKKYLNRRSYETRSEFARQTAQLRQAQEQLAPLVNSYERHRAYYQSRGITPEQLLDRATALDQGVARDKHHTAKLFLQGLDIDPLNLVGEDVEPVEQQIDPQMIYQQAQQEAYQKMQYEYQQMVMQDRTIEAQTTIDQFLNSKKVFTSDPYTASEIQVAMEGPVSKLVALNELEAPENRQSLMEILEEAYAHTIGKNPRFSALVQRDIQAEQAEKLNRASKSIAGGPGSTNPRKKHKTFKDALEANMDRL